MRKHKNKKVASAQDIYKYLSRCANEEGIANVTKREVAKHFGYKSSNGDGFLANFKFLEDSNLIENVAENKRNTIWKVNDKKNITFPRKCESIRNKKKEMSDMSILTSNKIEVERLRPINYNGRKYIPLVNISKVFNLDRYAVYNATSSNSKIISAYMQMIPTSDGSPSKKCIEVEGLPHLFEKLKRKVKPQILNATLKYINDNYLNDDNQEEDLSKNISQNVNNLSGGEQITIDLNDAKEYLEESLNKKEKAKEYLEESLNKKEKPKEYTYTYDATSDKNDFESYGDVLSRMDNLLNIAAEYSNMKEELETLKEENANLRSQLERLNGEDSRRNSNEIARLRDEIAHLEEKLTLSNRINSEFISKANILNKFVSESFRNSSN